jgi:polyhydroxybutyrate depolymerase
VRPYGLHVPAGADPTKSRPLVIFFHGYGSSGAAHIRAFGLDDLADAEGFVLAYPDGTVDARGKRFWNATDACCDFTRTGVDDVAYVRWLVDDVSAKTRVDPKRVYVMGHSNGGFLAHRLACELASRIAAAVSLAGDVWKDADRCRPSEPVSVLQIQGEADEIVRPEGGRVFDLPVAEYPSARDTVRTWATKDGCSGSLGPTGKRLDFDRGTPGVDTTLLAYGGCPPGVAVDFWTIARGSHFPSPTRAALEAVWSWMLAHPKR